MHKRLGRPVLGSGALTVCRKSPHVKRSRIAVAASGLALTLLSSSASPLATLDNSSTFETIRRIWQ
jgi:hypothetical protein